MTITHQIVTDAEGKPVAAQIPWDEFQVIKAEIERLENDGPLDPEWKAELDRRSRDLDEGRVEGVSHEEMMSRVREKFRHVTSPE